MLLYGLPTRRSHAGHAYRVEIERITRLTAGSGAQRPLDGTVPLTPEYALLLDAIVPLDAAASGPCAVGQRPLGPNAADRRLAPALADPVLSPRAAPRRAGAGAERARARLSGQRGPQPVHPRRAAARGRRAGRRRRTRAPSEGRGAGRDRLPGPRPARDARPRHPRASGADRGRRAQRSRRSATARPTDDDRPGATVHATRARRASRPRRWSATSSWSRSSFTATSRSPAKAVGSRSTSSGSARAARARGPHLLPSPEDLLLHVCLHFTRNRLGGSYRRRQTGGALAQICDIARIVEHEPCNWEASRASARSYGLDARSLPGAVRRARAGGADPQRRPRASFSRRGFDREPRPAPGDAARAAHRRSSAGTDAALDVRPEPRGPQPRLERRPDRAQFAGARVYACARERNAPLARSALRQPWLFIQDQRLNGQIRALEDRA